MELRDTARAGSRARAATVAVALVFVFAPALRSSAAAGATDYSGVVVIGDSLSDVGNIDALSRTFLGQSYPLPPYAPGRFSNGPVWVDYLGAGLGHGGASVPFLADPSRGTNYALGGAAVGFDNPSVYDELLPLLGPDLAAALSPWGMTTQAVMHLQSGGSRDNRELYVVWGGANDFWAGKTQTDTARVAETIGFDLLLLHAGGMRHALVPNLPPLGSTPRYLGTAEGPAMNALVEQYNRQFDHVLDVIDLLTVDLTIHRLNVHAIVSEILEGNDPSFNVTTPAFDGASIVVDPDRSLFWDEIHPTGVAHLALGTLALQGLLQGTLIDSDLSSIDRSLFEQFTVKDAEAAALAARVPEPATVALMVVTGGYLVTGRRFRPGSRR